MRTPLPTLDGYTLLLAPAEKPRQLRDEIIQTWLKAGAMRDTAQAEKRVDQVLAMVRAADGSIAALISAFVAPVPTLGDLPMWHIRGYTVPAHRRHKLGGHMVTAVRETLASRYAAMDATRRAGSPAGLCITLENNDMHSSYNHAVLPVSMTVYIGDNAKGRRQYVYYFEDSRLPIRPIQPAQVGPQ